MGQVVAFTGATRSPTQSREESRILSAAALASVSDAEVIPDTWSWENRHESFAWMLLSPTYCMAAYAALAAIGFIVSSLAKGG